MLAGERFLYPTFVPNVMLFELEVDSGGGAGIQNDGNTCIRLRAKTHTIFHKISVSFVDECSSILATNVTKLVRARITYTRLYTNIRMRKCGPIEYNRIIMVKADVVSHGCVPKANNCMNTIKSSEDTHDFGINVLYIIIKMQTSSHTTHEHTNICLNNMNGGRMNTMN